MRVFGIILFLLPPTFAAAQSSPPAWTIPSDEVIHQALADRLRISAGMVVGVIEPTGRRVVAFGPSGSPDGRPLDGDTLFQIGSVTKVLTGLLLADSAQRGEVNLKDPVSNYLPAGLVLRERGRPMTLLDLATHMSGLPSMPGNMSLRGRPDPVAAYSPRDLERFLATFEPARAPGEKWEYSNLGVSLLGRLLATARGKSYEALLRERVLAPLGMDSTAITLSRAQRSRVAPPHDRYGEPIDVWEMRTLQASGSLRSSANDLLNLLEALLGYRDTALRPAMELQLSYRDPVKTSQAIGWGTSKFDGRELFVHDGGKSGYRSIVAFDPTYRRGIVILVNARTDERLGALAIWLLNGKALPAPRDAPPPRPRITPNRRNLLAAEGRYRLDDGRVISVLAHRDRLFVDAGDGPYFFIAQEQREYFDPASEEELTFDAGAPAPSVTWYPKGRSAGSGSKALRIASAPTTP